MKQRCSPLLSLLTLFLVLPMHAEEESEPLGVVEQMKRLDGPRSVFMVDINNGSDPFFPNSRRLQPKQETDSGEPQYNIQEHPERFLHLKGIVGKLAVINGKTFSEGEKGEIQYVDVNQQRRTVRIQCLEIKATNVFITIPGSLEKVELQFEPIL